MQRLGYGDAAVDYLQAWELQRRLHRQRVADEIADTVLFLEHPFVYTAGRRTQPQDRPVDGTAVIDVDRGGKITWHGPGQLVAYPIVKLASHVYVVDYVRRLEEALIRSCADLGLATGRVAGRSGVWLPADADRPERKVAALGVRVSHGVTMHGIELNCDNTMEGFDAIVPCGLADAGVTTLSLELGRELGLEQGREQRHSVSVEEADPILEARLRELLDWSPYDRSPDIDRAAEPAGSLLLA